MSEKYTVCLTCEKKVKIKNVTARKTGIRGTGRPIMHYEFSCGHGSTALVNDVDGWLEHFAKNSKMRKRK
jgi:hypothetical protein